MTEPAAPLDGIYLALRVLQVGSEPAAAMAADVVHQAWNVAAGHPETYRAAVAAAVLAEAAAKLRGQGLWMEANCLADCAGAFGLAFRNALTLATVQVPDFPPGQ
jgi:hypothetical protein